MRKSQARSALAILLSVGVLSACGSDSTGPSGGDIDFFGVTQAGLSGLSSALNENEAKVTLDVLGSYITSITAQPAPPAPSGIAKIPIEALGGTYAYDEQLNWYVLQSGVTGAPADGVRFLLYTVDPDLNDVVLPLDEIGYIDIRDLSSGESIDVRHVAVVDGGIQLEFDVTGTLTATTADLVTSGTLSDGTNVATFEFGIQVTESGATTLDIDATVDTYRLLWEYIREGQYGVGPGSDRITLTESTSGAKIEMIIDWSVSYVATAGSVVEFNDRVVADVTGSGGFPEVIPRDGSGLEPYEADLLVTGYFEIFFLEAELLGLTQFGLANAGRMLPSF